MSAGARLRALLAGGRCVEPASVYDPLSARAAAELGYEAIFLAGSVAALAVLGSPDLNLLTLSEFVGLARRIARAGGPPLLVDADHGFGNALNVVRTVEELTAAGVAGMTLEDTDLPQRFGLAPAKVSTGEAVGKLRAALDARSDPAFMVIARTSAYMQEGLEAACARTAAYAAAGADGIFVAGLRTRADYAAIASAAGGLPLVGYAVGGDIAPGADLADVGVRLLVVGHAPFAASAQAAHRALAGQRGGEPNDESANALVARLSRQAAYREQAQKYLTTRDPA